MFFTPQEVSILKQHIISCHIFSAQYLKRYRKSSRWGPFEVDNPKSYQNSFFNPLNVQQTPRSFYMGDYRVTAGSLEEQESFLTICFSSMLPCVQCAIFEKSDLSDLSLHSLVTLQRLWIKEISTWISVGQCHKVVMWRYYYATKSLFTCSVYTFMHVLQFWTRHVHSKLKTSLAGKCKWTLQW